MAQSTLRSSVEESNRISEFIDSGKFLEYFKKNVLLEEEFLNSTSDSDDEIINNRNNNNKNSNNKKKRNYKPPGRSSIEDYFTETEWGKLLRKDSVRDPNSSTGQLFRRRFRLPFPVFELLVKLTKEYNLFDYTMHYKVLMIL